MKNKLCLAILVLIVLNLLGEVPTIAALFVTTPEQDEIIKAWNEGSWTGKNKDGSLITVQDIKEFLENHKLWLQSNGVKGKQIQIENADLSKAVLRGADLRKAQFVNCDFTKAILFSTNFNYSVIYKTKFEDAHLGYAKFRHARLVKSDFAKLRFIPSGDFQNASLTDSNFTGAYLQNADLQSTNLSGTNLSNADLTRANLRGAIFNPETLPPTSSIQTAENLSTLRYTKIPDKLMELRKAFKDTGLRRQEREITYAIKHTQRLALMSKNSSAWNKLEGIFFLIFFEWTCAYGMQPGRPLIILVFCIIPIFSICYIVVLKWPPKTDGIWKVWVSERVRKDLGSEGPELLSLRFFPAIAFGFYFSVISAFSIGWRDFNVGNWISRIQWREYTLRASGWARTVSGVQSLISVYLLALWVLTYFGRPFENV